MKGIIILFQKLWTLFLTYRSIMPILFVGAFVGTSLIIAGVQSLQAQDGRIFMTKISDTVFASDYNIYKITTNSISNNTPLGYIDLINIFGSVMVLWYLIKWTGFLLIKISGSQAEWGAYFCAFIIMGIIELVSLRIVDGTWFFPYRGMYNLVMNIPYLISNINLNPFNRLISNSSSIVETSNNTNITTTTLNESNISIIQSYII